MLSVQNLHKSYKVGNEKYEVLKGVSLEVQKGEFVGVMGPSGSGKSTLLNCISCYIPSDSGKIELGDTNLATLDEESIAHVRNEKLGFVFQDFLLLDGLTIRDNIMLPRIIGGKISTSMEKVLTCCVTCSGSHTSKTNILRTYPEAKNSALPLPALSSTIRS